MLRRVGPNVISDHDRRSWPRLLASQFFSPIEIILVISTVLAGFLGDWTDSLIILVILILSGVLGFVQEFSAGKAVLALLASVEVFCTVRRDAHSVVVPMRSVVPGDVAVLSAGDVLPGDGIVLTSRRLSVDQSALTGETFPVDKSPGPHSANEHDANAVFLGTHVVAGTGEVLIVRTGADSRIADIARRLDRKTEPTGFEHGMTRFGLLLTRVMVVLVFALFVINIILQRPPIDSALFSLALAVGLTPQLLPAIVAIGLSQGARRMARAQVIVRRLDAIEDIGSMTILCSDKTGTMTSGTIRLEHALAADGTESEEIGQLAALNARLQTGGGNPIDEAILQTFPGNAAIECLGEVPYDFIRRRLSIVARLPDDPDPIMVTKGALQEVRDACSHARIGATLVPIDQAASAIDSVFTAMSGEGFRVLGLATRSFPSNRAPSVDDEADMIFVGMLAFTDPVKTDASSTVSALSGNGVSVRMITGDNHLVAVHVARAVGLPVTAVLSGRDVARLGDRALAVAVSATHVFCELDPIQKERVVRAFRRAGHVVGYLGDGINDAPSLHAADVGITVDTAVPVARQAAAVVLLDKSLDVLLQGITEGRRTFANTMKYIFVNTSASFGNMLSMAIAAALLPFLPLLASQILVVNLLSDLPALAIATDHVDRQQIGGPQQWDTRLIRRFMIVFGVVSTVFDLITFGVLRLLFHAGATEFRSAWMLGSILTEVAVMFVLRTRGPFYRSRPGTGLVVSSAVVVLVAIWLPFSPLAATLGLAPIPVPLLGVIGVVVVAYVFANEGVKRAFWSRGSEPRGRRRRSALSRGF